MTSVCVAGGASQPKAGFGLSVTMSAAGLAARFAGASPWFAAAVAGVSFGVQYLLSDYCTHDPPEVPELTAQDFFDATNAGNFDALLAAQAKIQQWVGSQLWTDFCECTSGTQPTAPTPQSEPDDMPTQLTSGAPCSSVSAGPVVVAGATDNLLRSGSGSVNAVVGVTSLRIELESTGAGATEGSPDHISLITCHTPDCSIDDLVFETFLLPVGTNAVWIPTLVPGARNFQVSAFRPTVTDQDTVTGTLIQYCPGSGALAATGCCPPDPTLMAFLKQTYDLVTLLQRQVAPFAYVPGPEHSGLTDTGTIDLAASLGVLLNVSVPDRAGREAGTPETVFNVGWINFATPDGYTERFFVQSDSQVILPRLPGIYTNLGYSFAPDVTATITELAREP